MNFANTARMAVVIPAKNFRPPQTPSRGRGTAKI